MKKFIYSFLAVIAFAGFASAASEPALPDGNVTNTLVATVHTSSGTGRRGETRRLEVDELGEMLVVSGETEVTFSTGPAYGGFGVVGQTTNTFAVNASSWIGKTGCRGRQDNCNVLRIASQANKVYLKAINYGDVTTDGPTADGSHAAPIGRPKVRLFDSQGSTAPAFKVFEVSGTSGTVFPVEQWFSSGTVALIDSTTGYIGFIFGKQNR